MRIAFINNNNNFLFSAARYLRDRGHDVTLCVMEHEYAEAPHFHPSADTFDLNYQQSTVQLTWGDPKSFAACDFGRVTRDLALYDVLVGAGPTPAFVARAGRKLDVFVPYGSDLYESPFRPPGLNRRSLRSLVEFPYWVRRGIRECGAVYGDLSPVIEPPLKRLGYRGKRVVAAVPTPYWGVYNPASLAAYFPRSAWAPQVLALRERMDVLLHAPSRHLWAKTAKYAFSKGNDKLIRAIAAARDAMPDKRFGVIFYEYGPDVEASRALIAECGLNDNVMWLPCCARRDVMANLSISDLACGELGETSWYTAGTVVEPLCVGIPLLHRRDDAMFEDEYDELYPLISIRTQQDITAALCEYARNPDGGRDIGSRGRAWFERHIATAAVDSFESLVVAQGR
jgi:glycosyltransferase involved in cell wall biosynthesis